MSAAKSLRTFGSIRANKPALTQEVKPTVVAAVAPKIQQTVAAPLKEVKKESQELPVPCSGLNSCDAVNALAAYPYLLVKQFTVEGDAEAIVRVLGNLTTACTPDGDDTDGESGEFDGQALLALELNASCPNKSVLKFVPGTVDFTQPEPAIQSNDDVDQAESLLQKSGSRYYIHEVLLVNLDVRINAQTQIIDIVQRLYKNVEIISLYTALSVDAIILQVVPAKLWLTRQILSYARNDLGTLAKAKCYKCPTLPNPQGPTLCEGAVVNCGPLYPCEGGCPKPCDEKKKKRHHKKHKKPSKPSKPCDSESSSEEVVVPPKKCDSSSSSDSSCEESSEDSCPNGDCDYPQTIDHGCGSCQKKGLLTCGCKHRPPTPKH